MQKSQTYAFVICAFLVAMPQAALDVSSVKNGAPVRHGKVWEQRSEFTAPVRDGGRLVLRADQGAVSILPGATDHVTCSVILHAFTPDQDAAKRLFDGFQLGARSTEAGGVYLSSETPMRMRHGSSFQVQFEISLPQRFHLDVETQGGDVVVEAPLTGDARLTTAGGDVHTGDISGFVRIETASGNVTVGNVGNDLQARTAGGSIQVGDVKGDAVLETSGGEIATGTVNGSLKAETAGGDVIVGGATGKVMAQTAGGQIQIGHAGSSVQAETAAGSIRLTGAHGTVVAETVGGSIDLLEVDGAIRASTAAGRILAEFRCTKRTFGSSKLETSMGDVYVYLPNDLPMTIDAVIDTAGGRQIESDFPLDIQGDKDDLAASTIHGHGNVNGGGEILKIRTVAGNIEIRKIDDKSLMQMKQLEDSDWKTRHTDRDQRSHQQ